MSLTTQLTTNPPLHHQQLKRVLARVFRLFDAGRDGALSDAELNALQVHCFKSTLQARGVLFGVLVIKCWSVSASSWRSRALYTA